MPGEDRECAIDLLGRDDARKLVRKRDAPQREQQIRAFASGGRPAVRRPDRQHELLHPAVAQIAEPLGELLRAVLLPPAVEENRVSRSAPGLPIEPRQHSLTARVGCNAPLAHYELLASRHEAAGLETAAHSVPTRIEDGVLTVRCDSTAWATQLRLMRVQIATQIASR